MRTTIRLSDDLFREVKKLAAETGRTLSVVIADALRESLARYGAAATSGAVRLTTVGGNGVQPGVDLDDSAALTDLMDGRDDPR